MKQLLFAFFALLICASPNLLAQDKLDLKADDSVHSVLERQVGKPVELRMKSGEKIAGKLEKVTAHLAHLAQLTDADFYDAAVEIESVAAVVVRVRTN